MADALSVWSRSLPRMAYVAAAGTSTLSAVVGWHRTHAVTKAAMVPALQGSVVERWRALSPGARAALLGSTCAALVGDLLLVAPAEGETADASRRRLQRGAIAFAVQQAGYIAMLHRLGARPRWRSAVPVFGLLLGLAALDTAKESKPDLVVTTYGLLLGVMSAHAVEASDGRIRLGGAAFLISDALILVREQLLDEGSLSESAAQGAVMSTYALAQRWLVDGFIDGAAH